MSFDLMNLDRFSVNPSDYPLTLKKGQCYSRDFQVDLARRLNANAERIEFLMLDIATEPDRQMIDYKDILPWRQRVDYMRNTGQSKAAKRLAKRMALEEAKAADHDEEFMSGYQEFLDSEFNVDFSTEPHKRRYRGVAVID